MKKVKDGEWRSARLHPASHKLHSLQADSSPGAAASRTELRKDTLWRLILYVYLAGPRCPDPRSDLLQACWDETDI